mgnify:FL=1
MPPVSVNVRRRYQVEECILFHAWKDRPRPRLSSRSVYADRKAAIDVDVIGWPIPIVSWCFFTGCVVQPLGPAVLSAVTERQELR